MLIGFCEKAYWGWFGGDPYVEPSSIGQLLLVVNKLRLKALLLRELGRVILCHGYWEAFVLTFGVVGITHLRFL